VDRLRPLWDFDDLDLSERRLTEQLDREPDDEGRAEVLTQLARVRGLRGEFGRCGDLLDEAERAGAGRAVVEVRVPLERGRMLRSSGDLSAAYPLFVTAFERATAAGEHYLGADAAHMAALAAPDDDGFRTWTTRGIDLGEREPAAGYWHGPLLNNLGWALHEQGADDEALSAFEQALAVREETRSDEYAIEIARYAVAVALRALGRSAKAASEAERAVAWSVRAGRNDPYFHEELAEDYADLGRVDDAAEQARQALELFGADVTPAQRDRLEELSGAPPTMARQAPERERRSTDAEDRGDA
jgi:tetratricopeptide (TPR) repeat protein